MRTKARMFLGAFIVSFVVFLFLVMVLLVDFRPRPQAGIWTTRLYSRQRARDDGGKMIVLFNTEIEVPDFWSFCSGNGPRRRQGADAGPPLPRLVSPKKEETPGSGRSRAFSAARYLSIFNRFRRSAFVTTEMEDRLMAAAASMGLSSGPPNR